MNTIARYIYPDWLFVSLSSLVDSSYPSVSSDDRATLLSEQMRHMEEGRAGTRDVMLLSQFLIGPMSPCGSSSENVWMVDCICIRIVIYRNQTRKAQEDDVIWNGAPATEHQLYSSITFKRIAMNDFSSPPNHFISYPDWLFVSLYGLVDSSYPSVSSDDRATLLSE